MAEARDLGYDYVSTAQHFLSSPFEMLQPIPLLAHLAAESGDMRLVTTLVLPSTTRWSWPSRPRRWT